MLGVLVVAHYKKSWVMGNFCYEEGLVGCFFLPCFLDKRKVNKFARMSNI